MKTLRFCFAHPFKGHAIIKSLTSAKMNCRHFLLNSGKRDVIEVPLKSLPNGKYEIALDWETDNRFFAHQTQFEIISPANIQFSNG